MRVGGGLCVNYVTILKLVKKLKIENQNLKKSSIQVSENEILNDIFNTPKKYFEK